MRQGLRRHLGSESAAEVRGATCLSHLSELRGKNPNFADGSSEKKTPPFCHGLPREKRREQLLEGAKEYRMVEAVPEEGGE